MFKSVLLPQPSRAAGEFATIVPRWKRKEGHIKAVFNYYAELVYPGQKRLGEIDGARMSSLQDFYLKSKIIRKKSPLNELFTNEFIK